MTTLMRTLSGQEIDTGFGSVNINRILLGDLPNMTTQQFLVYAPMTVRQLVPALSTVAKSEWAEEMRRVHREVTPLRIRQSLGHYSTSDVERLFQRLEESEGDERGLVLDAIASVCSDIEDAVFYGRNPFQARSGGQAVAFVFGGKDVHVVTAEAFIGLTRNITQGGLWGWGVGGAWPEAKAAASELKKIFDEL